MLMPPLSPKVLKRIQKLWARMMDPSSDKESAAARTALLELLKKNGRTWHDLQKIMAEIEMQRMAAQEATILDSEKPHALPLWPLVRIGSTRISTSRC